MNAEQLRDLGFQLESRALGGESGGAWFADEGVADRYAMLLPALDVPRSRGVPMPEYPFVHRAIAGRPMRLVPMFSHNLFIPSSQISALPLVLSFQNRTGGEQCTSRSSTSTCET